jgi:hypothetical protein
MSQAWRPWRSYAVLHIWMSPAQAQRRPDPRRPAAIGHVASIKSAQQAASPSSRRGGRNRARPEQDAAA